MVRSQVILPRADAECGKAFYPNRRTADWHRIALEFWNQATGRVRMNYRLSVYRCKRCGGFHISQKRVENPGDSGKSSARPLGGKGASPDTVFRRPRRRNRNTDVGSAEVTDQNATDAGR
jgi:hypothetical protein